uniref:Pentatricopeptide repeat-containing protein n=1 Tax=Ananas comosus var. bracteatus TaxID=296719 RepID=A0A6V7PLX6_ANACO|nr:unnamed protein product [Ananas comosus var. bracteatus]
MVKKSWLESSLSPTPHQQWPRHLSFFPFLLLLLLLLHSFPLPHLLRRRRGALSALRRAIAAHRYALPARRRATPRARPPSRRPLPLCAPHRPLRRRLLHLRRRGRGVPPPLCRPRPPPRHLRLQLSHPRPRLLLLRSPRPRLALALDLFLLMLRSHLRPNEFTFPFALKSAAALDLLPLGHQIHSSLLKSGLFPSNVFCASALLDLYVKLATLGDARLVFDRIPHRTAVTWNSMICAYAQNGFLEEALRLMDSMAESGLDVGVTSWNSIVAGCVRFGDVELALDVLGEMISVGGVGPNPATFNTMLSLIPFVPSLDRIKELHAFALRNVEVVGFDSVDIDRLWSSIASGYASMDA